MKNNLRKLLPLLLALILLLSLAPAALAEEEESILDQEKLDAWIKEYTAAHDLNNKGQQFSVGFCYTATGDYWYYNGDSFMYSASMYKVPVSMLLAEKEAAGQLSQDSIVSGSSLRQLETTALIDSNNASGHSMLAYLGEDNGGKASKLCMQYASLDQAYYDQDFFDYSYYSARFITQVMKTLYDGGEERFPHVIEYLLQAQPNEYMNLKLKGKYQVAQKYGAFEERNGNYNNHVTAIIYTPNPIIVTVMTRNVGNFMPRMAEVGEYLANYALQLDEKLPAWQAAREAAALPQETEAPELIPDAPEGADPEGQDVQAQPEAQARPGQDAPVDRGKLMPALILMWAAIAGMGGMIVFHGLKVRGKKKAASAGRH